MRNILDHTSHPRKTNANPPTDQRYPPCINFSRETQGQAFDLLEQLEERVNLVPTVPYCVRGVALASIDRAGTTTVWRPRPSGGAFHDSLGGGTEFIGYADAAVLHPRGFTPFSPPEGRLHPSRGGKRGRRRDILRMIPKERAENEWAKGEEDVFRGSIESLSIPHAVKRIPAGESSWLNARRRHYFRKFRGPGKPYNFATPRPEIRGTIRHLWGGIRARQEFFKGNVERSFKSSLCYIYARYYRGEWNVEW